MKQYMKRLWLMLCMAACLFALTACSNANSHQQYEMSEVEKSELETQVLEKLDEITGATAEELDALKLRSEHYRDHAVTEAIKSWSITKQEMGAVKSVETIALTVEEHGYSSVVNVQCENGPLEIKMFFDIDMNMTSMSFVQQYTFSGKMTRAALNTALGMGTVFAVLIFISFLIGCFKYISVWENKVKAKQAAAAPVPAPVAPVAAPVPAAVPVIEEAEELVDDLELVAVITAAIAASANTTTEGLVVRSIKRASGAKWKKA